MKSRGLVLMLAALSVLAACGDDDTNARPTPTGIPTAAFTATAASASTATPTATGSGEERTRTSTRPPTSPTTPIATPTATPTRSVTGVVLTISDVSGEPGQTVEVSVLLTVGVGIAGTQNDIGFPSDAPLVAKANPQPDC